MKRRKRQQTIRANKVKANKRMAEQNVWTFIQDTDMIHQWSSFDFGTTSFTTAGYFSVGDLITIDGGDTTAWAGVDARQPVNPKKIHPARRRKAIQDNKDLLDDNIILTSGGETITCTKVDGWTWVVTGDVV